MVWLASLAPLIAIFWGGAALALVLNLIFARWPHLNRSLKATLLAAIAASVAVAAA